MFIATCAAVAIATTPSLAVQRSHDELVRALGSADEHDRREAVTAIRAVRRESRGDLEMALANELQRLNEVIRRRTEADRSGQLPDHDFPAEYYAEVAELVSQSSNPAVIPALAGALGTGSMVQTALAGFGDEAVPHVIQVARMKVGLVTTGSPGDVPPSAVSSALTTLRVIVTHSANAISAQSRASIEKVAGERLAGQQEGEVVAAACQLAVATRNPALRRRVERIVEQPSQLVALGLTDQQWIDFVQGVARQALAGK